MKPCAVYGAKAPAGTGEPEDGGTLHLTHRAIEKGGHK